MSPKHSQPADLIRVQHMIDAIHEALSFIQGMTRAELEQNRMCTLSLIKEIEIIGEAACKVSDGFQEQHHDIPWSAIIGTRNRLIHGYFDVDLDIIWQTVTQDLPELAKSLEKIIAQ